MKKKFVTVSLILAAILGFSGLAFAQSSVAQITPKNLDAKGATIYVTDGEVMMASQNYGTIDFYAHIMRARSIIWDVKEFTILMQDYDEYYDQSVLVSNKADYYARSEWSGEAGAAYVSGETLVSDR